MAHKKINPNDLLKCGTIITDREYFQKEQNEHIRICKIKYQDVIYHVRIENDEVTKMTQWDNLPYDETQEEIHSLSKEDLLDLFMFSSRDRKQNQLAQRVYLLCVYEINTRYGKEIEILEKEYMN